MLDTQLLYDQITNQKDMLRRFQPEIFDIPDFITNNLKYDLFDWQKEALENLLLYEHPTSDLKHSPTHLMFNMATGTGKTLLMAAAILYYYQQGYRHFLFFVNQNNIIDKTENNFIDSTHTKYLFAEKIVIDDKTVNIKKVDTFSPTPQGIEIKFTTVQKFYNDIHQEKENQTTLEDLQELDLIMLADEAHHLNTNTKNLKTQELLFDTELKGSAKEKEKKGWEHTILEYVFRKYHYQDHHYPQKNHNVLLEFTATIPEDQTVADKYQDKIIYKFGLKEFLQAGYTKEINLISSSLGKKQRILQALLFQWYRHKIALKYGIANFKPVMLLRSKTIADSHADYEQFFQWIHHLSHQDFDFLTTLEESLSHKSQGALFDMGKSRTQKLLHYIREEEISLSEIIHWIQTHYHQRSTIITNSHTNSSKTEKTDQETETLLNSLEDTTNPVRAIFTVSRLTEGWDVLNLFDIVRLYESRDSGKDTTGNRKAGSSTIAEKQLIGRGVRYYPFPYQDYLPQKRKFDQDLDHDLRILEELYFYSNDDHRYIDELKHELKKDGYIQDDKVVKTFQIKPEFKNSSFYQQTTVWYNTQIDNPQRRQNTLENIRAQWTFRYRIGGFSIHEQELEFSTSHDTERLSHQERQSQTIRKTFDELESHIVQKAIHIKAKQANHLLQFQNLKQELAIESLEDLQTDFLADFPIEIIVPAQVTYDDIDNQEKLTMVMNFLDRFISQFKTTITPKIGSEFRQGSFPQFFGKPKTKTINPANQNDTIAQDNHWYVLDGFVGTSEEQYLVNFIQETITNLKHDYQEIYLLRNEEVYTMYNFEDGRAFQPDFLLFLQTNDKHPLPSGIKTHLYYQIFIEPKGDEFIGNDGTFHSGKEGWKETFLEKITEKYGYDQIITSENPQYRLIGFPFFNQHQRKRFEEEFNQL